MCMHNVEGVAGSERLLRGQSLFISRGRRDGLPRDVLDVANADASLILFDGISSWGAHQLEGEVTA